MGVRRTSWCLYPVSLAGLCLVSLGACAGERSAAGSDAMPSTMEPAAATAPPQASPEPPAAEPVGAMQQTTDTPMAGAAAPAALGSATTSDAGTAPLDAVGDGGARVDAGDLGTAPSDDDRCDVAVLDPAQPPQALPLSGNLGTHDPTAMERDGTVYILQTGGDFGTRLPGKTSTDMRSMDGAFGALGSQNPPWVAERVPAARNLWAPDLSFFGGRYHVYYSASSFGSNSSCMGHATSAAIGEQPFEDHGPVLCSAAGDDFNAIDPNVVVDREGTPWLFFGSFWDGIRAARLDERGERADDALHRIASRGGGAIEAPVVVRRCGYYYLFVSFDSCCQGARSTYNIRVGRSEHVLGPYVDREGRAMLEGGGTLLVEGDATFAAAGHNAVLFRGERAFNLYHAYRRADGQPELRVAELAWDESGWPVSGGP